VSKLIAPNGVDDKMVGAIMLAYYGGHHFSPEDTRWSAMRAAIEAVSVVPDEAMYERIGLATVPWPPPGTTNKEYRQTVGRISLEAAADVPEHIHHYVCECGDHTDGTERSAL
jgi:hypothetical protein